MINTYVQKHKAKYVFNIGIYVQRTRYRGQCQREIKYREGNLLEESVKEERRG